MKKSSAILLKAAIVLIGIVVLAGMIRFPQTEGRAANLDLISIYSDPFIIYIYLGTVPFFIGLYQAFKLTSHVSAKALCNIKYCALATIGFLIGAILYIHLMAKGDDPAGPTMIGMIAILTSAVIAKAADILQKRLAKGHHA